MEGNAAAEAAVSAVSAVVGLVVAAGADEPDPEPAAVAPFVAASVVPEFSEPVKPHWRLPRACEAVLAPH